MTGRAKTSAKVDARSTLIDVAARLLQENGPTAVTTRAVAQAAGVQAPTIYRLFGDKDGLLEAVAEHVMATYVSAKAAIVDAAAADNADPLDNLRSGWQSQIDFALSNPALFTLLSDPARGLNSPAAHAGIDVLRTRVHRLAMAHRLRISEDRAVNLIRAAGSGAALTLLTTPPDERDQGLPHAIFEAVLREILSDAPDLADRSLTRAAVTVRAHVTELGMLSRAEQRLMSEWLDRAIQDV